MNNVKNLQTINKQWQCRLEVVLAMEKWVCCRLSEYVVIDGHVCKRRVNERMSKGKEYLYCHLLLGKTLHPDGDDPLFTDAVFEDVSLRKQLELDFDGTLSRRGVVDRFQIEMQRRRDLSSTEIHVMCTPVVLIADVKRSYLNKSSAAIVESLGDFLAAKHESAVADELIIGLILRYRCIGGFESNQHGSIASAWGRDEFFHELTECFASPLNHVFENYYSMFKEDVVFGSKGDFLSANHMGLPLTGDFEMNPPFEETILDAAAEIVCLTFRNPESRCRLVMFTPDWKDSAFFSKLNALTLALTGRALQHEAKLTYEHASGESPRVNSLVFVFIGNRCSGGEAAEFIMRCRANMLGSVSSSKGSSSSTTTDDGFTVVARRLRCEIAMERVVDYVDSGM